MLDLSNEYGNFTDEVLSSPTYRVIKTTNDRIYILSENGARAVKRPLSSGGSGTYDQWFRAADIVIDALTGQVLKNRWGAPSNY